MSNIDKKLKNNKFETKSEHKNSESDLLKKKQIRVNISEINNINTLNIEKKTIDFNFTTSGEVFYKNFSTLYGEIFMHPSFNVSQKYDMLRQDLNILPNGHTIYHSLQSFIFFPSSITGIEQKDVEFIRRKVFSILFLYSLTQKLNTIIKNCKGPQEDLQKITTKNRILLSTFLTNVKIKSFFLSDISAESKNELQHFNNSLKILEKQAWSLLSIITPVAVSAAHRILERIPEYPELEAYTHDKKGYISYNVFKKLILGETITKDLKNENHMHTDISILTDLINLLGPSGLPLNFMADLERRNKLNSLLINIDKLLQLIYIHHVVQDQQRLNKTLNTILPLYRNNIIKMNDKVHDELFTNKSNVEISKNLYSSIMSVVTNVSFGLLAYLACEIQPQEFLFNLFEKKEEEFINDYVKVTNLIKERELLRGK